MRVGWRTGLWMVLALAVAGGCSGEWQAGAIASGEPRLDFSLASLAGGRLGPGDYGGQVVVIDFWATWCGPCHLQADILRSLHAEFALREVAFLAVSVGEPVETVRSFVAERPFPYPALVDPADEVGARLGVYVLPTVMVLDRSGRVVYRQEGISSARRLRHVIEETLASSSDSMAF